MATRWNSSYLAWSRLIDLKEWIKLLSNTLSTNTDADSKKDARRLKQILISDDEWNLLTDLTEVLSLFADVTTELGGSKNVTNSLRVRMLLEIIKTIKPNLTEDQDIDEEEDVFSEEDQDLLSNDDINKSVITFGLLDEVKLKFWPTLKTNWMYWPLAAAINFTFVPTQF